MSFACSNYSCSKAKVCEHYRLWAVDSDTEIKSILEKNCNDFIQSVNNIDSLINLDIQDYKSEIIPCHCKDLDHSILIYQTPYEEILSAEVYFSIHGYYINKYFKKMETDNFKFKLKQFILTIPIVFSLKKKLPYKLSIFLTNEKHIQKLREIFKRYNLTLELEQDDIQKEMFSQFPMEYNVLNEFYSSKLSFYERIHLLKYGTVIKKLDGFINAEINELNILGG